MPDAAGLLRGIFDLVLKNGFGRILWVVAKERDTGGVPGIESEIKRFFGLDPFDAQRPRFSR